jgi:hypothetical protein
MYQMPTSGPRHRNPVEFRTKVALASDRRSSAQTLSPEICLVACYEQDQYLYGVQ